MRHRLLYLFLRDLGLFDSSLRVLHFAPEPRLESALRSRPNLDYVSMDLEQGHAMIRADITAIPAPDASLT